MGNTADGTKYGDQKIINLFINTQYILKVRWILVCAFILLSNCNCKEKSFLNSHKKFKKAIWDGEGFVVDEKDLSDVEKTKLKFLLSAERIVFKDTLDGIYIKNDFFYDEPQFLFSTYTVYLLDSIQYKNRVLHIDSINKINK